jgi:Arc/MetJ-type ribon-helix-helix transcriptional regulator
MRISRKDLASLIKDTLIESAKKRKYKGKEYKASPGSIETLKDDGFDIQKSVKDGDFDWAEEPYAAANAAYIVAKGKPAALKKESKMKITRRQLSEFIREALNELQASDQEVEAAKKKLSDEGGAAGSEAVAQAARDVSDTDTDASDEEIVAAVMAKDDTIKKHPDGDIVDTSGLSEAKKK